MDYRDVSHARGVNGVVFKIGKGAGSAAAVTEAGVIVHTGKKLYLVPSDRFQLLPSDAVIQAKLEEIREAVQAGTFDWAKQNKVSMQKAHSFLYGQSPGGK
eukprot:9926401-Ditylum_brightwellii.AAC.1